MEKITVFGPEHFQLRPDAPEVFGWLGCGENMPCYGAYREAWPEAAALLWEHMRPQAALAEHDDLATVF